MVEMGSFLNKYAANLQVFWPLLVAVVLMLPVLAFLYNRWIDSLTGKEHISIYVAIGNLGTIIVAGIISWKAAILFLILFGLDGLVMIWGEYRRTEKREKEEEKNKKLRNKRAPYKVTGYLKDADEAVDLANRYIGASIDATEPDRHFELLSRANHEIANAISAIKKARKIQEIN